MWGSRSKIGQCCFVMPQMILKPSSATSVHFQRFDYISENRQDYTITRTEPWHSCCLFSMCVCVCVMWFLLLCLHPCLPPCCSCCCYSSFPLLSFSVFAITVYARVSTCRVHASHATHTHTHRKYGYVLPSTDAKRITVREITVNICSMNMMRLAEEERRGG